MYAMPGWPAVLAMLVRWVFCLVFSPEGFRAAQLGCRSRDWKKENNPPFRFSDSESLLDISVLRRPPLPLMTLLKCQTRIGLFLSSHLAPVPPPSAGRTRRAATTRCTVQGSGGDEGTLLAGLAGLHYRIKVSASEEATARYIHTKVLYATIQTPWRVGAKVGPTNRLVSFSFLLDSFGRPRGSFGFPLGVDVFMEGGG